MKPLILPPEHILKRGDSEASGKYVIKLGMFSIANSWQTFRPGPAEKIPAPNTFLLFVGICAYKKYHCVYVGGKSIYLFD